MKVSRSCAAGGKGRNVYLCPKQQVVLLISSAARLCFFTSKIGTAEMSTAEQ